MVARDPLFRFVLLYFTLYFVPFPLPVLSGLSQWPIPFGWIGQAAGFLEGGYDRGFDSLVVWVGEHVLGAGAVVIQPTGSGDTMAQYVRVACLAAFAALGTIVWRVWNPDRFSPARVYPAFRVYVRYALSMVLLAYGFAKVPPLQFQPPPPELLVRTYGESSPMGLLWTFMGHSPPYTMFAGLSEIVPGLLLLFRNTTALGALIGAATMSNVAVLNFSYDVPVKLYSTHLLFTALIIAAPDLPRIYDVFVRNRPTPAVTLRAAPRRRAWTWVKAAYILILIGGNVVGGYQAWYAFGPGAPRPEIAGVYEVESFALDGVDRPPLWTDRARWRRFIVNHRGFVMVQHMGDQNIRYSYKHDPQSGTFTLTGFGSKEAYTLTSRKLDDGKLLLEGPFRDGQVRVELKKAPARTFPLQTRGFNWVQELPFNR